MCPTITKKAAMPFRASNDKLRFSKLLKILDYLIKQN